MPIFEKLGSDPALLAKYLALPQPDHMVQVCYVWIDGRNGLRCKTRTIRFVPQTALDLPVWNFNGSSTYQSVCSDSDVYLRPIRLYADPFRGGNNKIALCETLLYDGTPTKSNTRNSCAKVMELVDDQVPWFGIEQEYSLLDGTRPLGWPEGGFPDKYGDYFCSLGTGNVVGRDIVESHYRACLYAGIPISGINSEALLSQWEFQVGPCLGITMGDHLWMARYLLKRVAEEYNVGVTFDPKLVPGDWFGAGAHTNFSTKAMRKSGGITVIEEAIKKLERTHQKHMVKYDLNGGADNRRRLTGSSTCTSTVETFKAGVADRSASVRIPRQVAIDGCGYLEDRRPAANIDPYVVTEQLVRTILLE